MLTILYRCVSRSSSGRGQFDKQSLQRRHSPAIHSNDRVTRPQGGQSSNDTNRQRRKLHAADTDAVASIAYITVTDAVTLCSLTLTAAAERLYSCGNVVAH